MLPISMHSAVERKPMMIELMYGLMVSPRPVMVRSRQACRLGSKSTQGM